MASLLQLALAALLVAQAAPDNSVKWGLWKQKGFKSTLVEIYATRDECEAQLAGQPSDSDGWRFTCRPR